MSNIDVLEHRVASLEKTNDKQTEIINEMVKQVAVMQTKFIFIGAGASAITAGAISLAFKLLGGH